MRKDFKYSINQGLPGGANELKKFVQGSISVTGYKSDSPDVNNDFNIIPSNRITMQGVNFPVLGVDDFGYEQMMMPGGEYSFPGNYVTEIPQMGKGGLTQWFAEEWTDVKTGKKCGRSGKEKSSRPYPACRPKKRVNKTTPKTVSEMSAAEKAKFKREKKSGKRINYNHKRKEFGGQIGWLDNYQDGGNIDPEFMFKDKYNTELTPSEEADFSKWAAKESERQGRDILNDIGAYDVKGFWKSGDYKNMDSDNHGTDTWKKPNHPTFSNQSRYHGADGWYGGNWTDKAGYQPSKQTLETYGPDYYDWMFKSEPGRSEYLDMSRYESGVNTPSPFIYQIGGHIIQPGETFYGIANKYGIPNKDLLGANTDVNIDKIRAGQRIRIPESFSQNQYPTGYFETSDSETFNRKSKVYPTPKKETQVKISRDLNNDLLLRQAFAESTFNPKAVSPAGYMGLAQIGNDVITDYKKATGVKNVDPYDPKQNAEVQKWAMNQIYNADFVNKEGQDPSVRVAKTLASYNWGKGNVLKHLKKQKAKGVDIYNSLDWVESLPKETRDYIHKIQLSDMPEFNKGFDKAIKDKQYKQYIDLYKKKYGGWLDNYQDGGELPQLNSKMDVANFYKNPLSEKYGIAQNPDTGSFEYYLKSGQSSDPVKQEVEELESQNLRKAYVPSLSEEVSRMSDVVLPEVKQQQSRSRNIEKTYELERQKDFIDSQLYNEPMGPQLDPSSLPIPSYSGMNPIQEYYANLLYDQYGKFVITDKGENKTFYGTKTKDGDWDVNSFEVLTGRASDPRYQQVLKEELAQRRNDQYGITPIGVFPLSKKPNYYGSPGFKVEGSSLNPKVTVAYHTVFNPKKRLSLFENEDLADNYASSGCINCKKPNLDALINFVGQNGLSATIDSRLPLDKNIEWTKKNTPKYKKWLDNYK